MTTYIVLLRAVNVGGTGKLPMLELQDMCRELGFGRIETYIASGNVVFDCEWTAALVQTQLEKRLRDFAGKAVGVFVRTATEMEAVLKNNPFPAKEPGLTYTFFLEHPAAADALDDIRGRDAEEIRIGGREIYVYYPKGMGRSKLRIPAARLGTARNLNTVAKLVQMAARKK